MKNFIKIFAVIFLFLNYFFVVKACSAITFSVSGSGVKVNQEDEIGVNVDIGGLSSETVYFLQTRIKSVSINNYFGFTKNSKDNWFKYSSVLTPDDIKSKFFSFTTDKNGSWSGTIKSKLDTEDDNYKGSGDYILQVLRYTGNSKSESGISNDYDFAVLDTRPTVTPTPSPTDTPSPTLKISKTPTPLPTPKNSPTKTQETLKNLSPTIKEAIDDTESISTKSVVFGDVLGTQSSIEIPKKKITNPAQNKKNNWGKIYIIIGVLLICIPCGILAYKKYLQEKEEQL